MMKEIKGYNLKLSQKIKKKSIIDFKDILLSGNLTNGKFIKRFEDKFKNLHKSKYAIACSSGGSALEIIFKSLNIKDKEVLVPSNTFIATYNAIKFSGAKPILVDTKKNSLLVSLNEIKKKVTKNTKCVCIVHVGAHIPPDIIKIKKFCKKKNLYLVEDCAHATLSKFNNIYAGNYGDAAAFSFFATKSITSAEGGMILSNNNKLHLKMKSMTTYGMSQSYGNYDYKYFSSNYRMNEFEAVLGYHFLNNYSQYKIEKEKIKNKYDKFLSKKLIKFDTETNGNLYKYICILKNLRLKKKIISYLKKHKINLSGDVYLKPLHKYKLIKKENNVSLKNSLDICNRHICLPMYLGLKSKEVDKIINTVNHFISKNY